MHSVVSNLSLVFGPRSSFLQGISCLQTPLLIVELSWWLHFQHFFYLQFHQFLPFFTQYWFGRDFWLKRFWMKWNFVSFYYDSMLFSSKLLQNVSIFLLMEPLEYFLTRIIFLSMVHLSGFPLNWFFWIQIHSEEGLLWSSYTCHISVTDSLSFRSSYDVAVFVVGYHYGIFSIRFLWEKSFAPHIFLVQARG